MSADVIAREGPIMLGSRLKRLAERLQGGAERLAREAGIDAQPSQMPVLITLHRDGPANVGEIAARLGISQPSVTRILIKLTQAGLVEAQANESDRRSKPFALTARGREQMERAVAVLWPRVKAAVEELCDCEALLRQVATVEARLEDRPLERRPANGLSIRRYSDELAPVFRSLNEAWIREMFSLEAADEEVLQDPRRHIVDPGGEILFVEVRGCGIVGTCALKKSGPGEFELTKMCVSADARGRKAGEFVLKATIMRAIELGASDLYLLTNSKCGPAIHLYEKLGFVHDSEVMERFGSRYRRCDVAMRYPIGKKKGRSDAPALRTLRNGLF
jgi:DNA-binding MarR family transcriptional regulator/N-acetylglutamate synthase-like GNAT family acetyltransferase